METQKIWNRFNDELYFYILKKVKDKNAANDVFQNTFLKIHKNLHQLKDESKVKAWVFQIVRNEINNYFNTESKYSAQVKDVDEDISEKQNEICCFDKFIDDLPNQYKEVIELVYTQGNKQSEAAKILNISLHNVKARIRRGKSLLKKNFNECCNYEFDANGKLKGEPNCPKCDK